MATEHSSIAEAVLDSNLPSNAQSDETEAGNYFVANYPPFSFWEQEQLGEIDRVLAQPAAADTNLGVYFHIPFCRKRCHFCYFRVYTDRNAAEINGYIQAGIKEFEAYAKKPYLAGRKPQFIYFGGGTPSFLSVKQLTELTNAMKSNFPWDEAEEVAFEAEPGTLTEKKLEAIREIGITRLSLGIENFDDHILDLNGRAHRSKEAHRALKFAQSLDFDQLNIDLIAGMVDETEDNWKNCVEQAINYGPECVTIYQMEVPYNTTLYKEMKTAGKLTAPVANWETKRRWVDYAFDEFVKAGYTVSSATTVVKNPENNKFVYRDSLWEGADLLSAGVASFGHFGGVHYQNNHDIGPYMMALDKDELPIYRAYSTSAEEQLVREFILRLKLGHVTASYYIKKYGVDPRERFAKQLKFLVSEGFGELNGDDIWVNRQGLLVIDRLLQEFFLPKHQNARYA
ncbi:MAG: oxygen-independent coproporphyrinogen-3 oxidase [Verrucomicrobiales bacterium]|jgi:oxygen-independent coproporphyrinogen-3 oxidase